MIKDRINAYIDKHKDEMIETLKSLIEIPSYQGEAEQGMPFGKAPAEALKKALEISKDFGFSVRNFDNYVGTADFCSGEPQLGILCHLDVVPEGNGWTYPPYSCIIKDDKIYGRGTIDDKGPAVAVLYAMKALKELNIPISKNFRFIMGTNEENGSKDLQYYRKIESMPPMLFTPDGHYPVINIEKGMLRVSFKSICNNATGKTKLLLINGGKTINAVPSDAIAKIYGLSMEIVQEYIDNFITNIKFIVSQENNIITIESKGKSAHASTPENGDNAMTALIKLLVSMPFDETEEFIVLKNLAKLFPYGETNGKSVGLECKDIKSGELTLVFSVLNFECGKFEGKIDIRFPLCQTITGVITKLTTAFENCNITITHTSGDEPHHVDEGSKFVQTLLKVYNEQTGLEPYCLAIGGGTYVHNTEGGVAFGAMFPNDDNNMHGIDEFISIEKLLLNAKIYAHAIVEICS